MRERENRRDHAKLKEGAQEPLKAKKQLNGLLWIKNSGEKKR